MIILGDKYIPFEELVCISDKKDISNTKANTTLSFKYDIKLLKYTYDNSLASAVLVSSLKEAIYANSLKAKYIICENDISKDIQNIAENYIFDSKVLEIIKSEDEIEQIALKQIDGAIYKNILGKL